MDCLARMNKGRLSKVIYFVILIMLIMPICFQIQNFVSFKKLEGVYEITNLPMVSRRSFLSGEFQSNFEKFMQDNIKLRPLLVRIHNQIYYWIFHESKAVVIGKKGELFTQEYIDAFWGKDFVGEKEIQEKTDLAILANLKLKERGKHLIFVLAPSKADVFPEKLPYKKSQISPDTKTNYAQYSIFLKDHGLSVFDFNKEFKQNKTTAVYALYPKCGAHWSEYWMIDSMNQVFAGIESQGQIKMHQIITSGWDTPTKERASRNNELELLMNLLLPMQCGQIYYPVIRVSKGEDEIKPNVLVIADSYYGTFFRLGLERQMFENYAYYYYFRTLKDLNNEENPQSIENLDIDLELRKFDFIIVMHTTHSLQNLGYGFLEEVCQLYNC